MDLSNLKPAEGSTKNRKRIGRGQGSGRGGTSTRGNKGAKSRSGYSRKLGFEGGQMPLYRRLPKRGFTNIFAKKIVSINLDRLNVFESGTEVTPEVLLEKRVISKVLDGVKILGNGTIEKSLTVKGCKFSKSAIEKIEAAGGKVEVM